jgi:hypothetical protein
MQRPTQQQQHLAGPNGLREWLLLWRIENTAIGCESARKTRSASLPRGRSLFLVLCTLYVQTDQLSVRDATRRLQVTFNQCGDRSQFPFPLTTASFVKLMMRIAAIVATLAVAFLFT